MLIDFNREKDCVPICKGKLKRKDIIEPYYVYMFGTFTIFRKQHTYIGLRVNRTFKNISATTIDKYMILGTPTIEFTHSLPAESMLKNYYRDAAIYGNPSLFELIEKKK